MSKETVTIIDNRTGKEVELPIVQATQGPSVVDIGKFYQETGLFTYDPGFLSTASCDSAITFIDGVNGILQYGGYSIESLAEQSNFLEVSYLMLNGELPEKEQQEKGQIKADSAERAATPESLDVDFIQNGVQESDSDFIDLGALGSTASTSTSTPSTRLTDPLTPAEVVGQKTLVKRYGEVSGLTSDDGTERQFPSRKKDRKSHFLERFIFTVD